MTYTPYYLRFSSERTAKSKLRQANYEQTETFEGQTHKYYSVTDQVGDIDIVGDIWNDDGTYDEETFEVITPPTKKDGYHINIILEGALPEVLQPYVVEPQNPHRVFA
jgi:hypothetical protein